MTTVVWLRSARYGGHGLNGSLTAVDEAGCGGCSTSGARSSPCSTPRPCSQRLLEVARELTGARYAAIGVLDERASGSSAS